MKLEQIHRAYCHVLSHMNMFVEKGINVKSGEFIVVRRDCCYNDACTMFVCVQLLEQSELLHVII